MSPARQPWQSAVVWQWILVIISEITDNSLLRVIVGEKNLLSSSKNLFKSLKKKKLKLHDEANRFNTQDGLRQRNGRKTTFTWNSVCASRHTMPHLILTTSL